MPRAQCRGSQVIYTIRPRQFTKISIDQPALILKQLVVDVKRRGQQGIDIDRGFFAEQETVLVVQVDLPVGLNRAENLAGILVKNLV